MNAMERALAAAVGWLESTGRRWYLFGAHAVGLHAAARQTQDVDFTIELEPRELPDALTTLGAHGLTSRAPDPVAFAARYHVLPLLHPGPALDTPVDIILAGTPGERRAMGRAVERTYLGVPLRVISAEDLVISKHASERERDVEDARTLVRVLADELDDAYIREGLSEREELLDRSDLVRDFERLLMRYRGG